jgi:hypothetical protein
MPPSPPRAYPPNSLRPVNWSPKGSTVSVTEELQLAVARDYTERATQICQPSLIPIVRSSSGTSEYSTTSSLPSPQLHPSHPDDIGSPVYSTTPPLLSSQILAPELVEAHDIELSIMTLKKPRRPGMIFIKTYDEHDRPEIEEIQLSPGPQMVIDKPDRGALARFEGRLMKMRKMETSWDTKLGCGCGRVVGVVGKWLPGCLGYARGESG